MRTMRLVPVVVGLAVLSLAAGRQARAEDDFERPPISYSATTPDNPIERPGDVVRSVYPDATGQPLFSAGSYRLDHTTRHDQRWGGWYVTGRHGSATHLGNITYRSRPDGDVADDRSGLNVEAVSERFNAEGYLTPHSDLVALTVLAHQAHGHNVLTKASFDDRAAIRGILAATKPEAPAAWR